jgi:membrane associated rhomboid family serine protease
MKNNTFFSRFTNIIWTYLLIFIPMWSIFFINNVLLSGKLNTLGIEPRTVKLYEIIPIMSSWLLHMDHDHILNNSIVLAGILWIVALLEKRIFSLLTLLIFTSGSAVWILGSPHSIHIGASGLVFALLGYILSASTIGKKFIYLIPLFLFGGSYWYVLKEGLIPQEGVSFAGHFGGFIAGILVGYFFGTTAKNEEPNLKPYRKSLKQRISDKLFDIKVYIKCKLR